ncbi:hypothetical protein [Cupriavidus necator]
MPDSVLSSAVAYRLTVVNQYLTVLHSSAACQRRRIHRLKLRGHDVHEAVQILHTQCRAIRALERVRKRTLAVAGRAWPTLAPNALRGLCPIVSVVVT